MIWKKLKKPILILAPMDDVTDVVFRQVIAETAPPDLFFTEFTNCDALFSPGRKAHIRRLKYTDDQKPIIAQIWGPNPDNYYRTAKILQKMGFDGIDINMGCPDKNIMKSGACSALIDNPSLAQEIIKATKEGAGDLPVSVKTRLGITAIKTEDWIGFLLEQDLDALILHGRISKEMSKFPAKWDEIAKAVDIRDRMRKNTFIIGNGDVTSYSQALKYSQKYKVDGIMIGRGIFEDLWVFHPEKTASLIPLKTKLKILKRHVNLFHDTWSDTKNPDLMKKFLKVYINGFNGANNFRKELMEARSLLELTEKIDLNLNKITEDLAR